MVDFAAVLVKCPRLLLPGIGFRGGVSDVLIQNRVCGKLVVRLLRKKIEDRFRFGAVGCSCTESRCFVVRGDHIAGDFAVRRESDEPLDVSAVPGAGFRLGGVTDDFSVFLGNVELDVSAGCALDGEFCLDEVVVKFRKNGFESVIDFFLLCRGDRTGGGAGDESHHRRGDCAEHAEEESEIEDIDFFLFAHLAPPCE